MGDTSAHDVAVLQARIAELESTATLTGDAAVTRVRKLNALLWAIRHINQLILVEDDPERLLQGACDLLTSSMGYQNAWATHLDPQGEVLLSVGSRFGTELRDLQDLLHDGRKTRCMDRALQQPGEVAVLNPPQDCADCPLSLSYPGNRGMSKALAAQARSLGTLTVCVPPDTAADPEQHALLTEVAGDLGFALASIQRNQQHVRQAAILDEIVDHVIVTDLEGRVLHRNRAAQSAQTPTAVDHFDPAVVKAARDIGAWQGTLTEYDASGRPRRLECHAWRLDDNDDARGMICVVLSDVTERDQAQLSATTNANLLEQLSAGVPGFMFQVEHTPGSPPRFLFVSSRVDDLLECSPAELRTDASRLLERIDVLDRHRMRRFILRALASGQGGVEEFRVVLPKAGQRWLRGSARCEPTLNGSTLWHGYVQDVTERVELEQRLRHSEKMEAVGQLAGGVAHDFNNLLMSILGNAELAQLTVEETPHSSAAEVLEHLAEIQGAADRAATVTRQLLSFSRRDSIDPRAADLNRIITNMLKLIRRTIGEQVELHYIPEAEQATVFVDSGQLEQVLLNLCVNARDAMPNGGPVVISTHNAEFDGKDLSGSPWARPGRYIVLRVVDKGLGIPDELKAQIFEPFFTTKETGRGTGLGLATVYGIVQRHNGHISYVSTPGQGTSFSVALPITTSSTDTIDLPTPVAHQLGQGQTILIAEDQPALRRLAQRTLEGAGYRTLLAANGQKALELIDDHGDQIALALLDVVMPVKDGVQVARYLQAHRPQTALVFMTGHTHGVLAAGETLPPNGGIIRKPYTRQELLTTLQQALRACPAG